MLSRGGNRPGRRGRAPTEISVYGALRGTLETGLTPVALESDGTTIPSDEIYGGQVELGAYGTHSWRRSILGLDYRGDYRQTNSNNSQYNGTNQAISIDLQHQFSRRMGLVLSQSGGTTNRAFGGFAAPVADPQGLNLANNEVFDSRSYFSQTGAIMAYRKSARLSFVGGADVFFVKRPDPRLVGTAGLRGSAGASYRLSSRTSVGANYTYMRYEFKRAFADSKMHGVLLTASRIIGKNWQVSGGIGILHLRTTGTRAVELSPEVAALLGQSRGIEAFRDVRWSPQLNLSAGYSLERSMFNFSYATGVVPGNGVYLTSKSDTVSAGYSYAGIRKLSVGASAAYSRYGSIGLALSSLQSYRGGGGFNYVITRMMNLSSQLDYRVFNSPGLRGREGFALTLGLSFSPGRFPVAIW